MVLLGDVMMVVIFAPVQIESLNQHQINVTESKTKQLVKIIDEDGSIKAQLAHVNILPVTQEHLVHLVIHVKKHV